MSEVKINAKAVVLYGILAAIIILAFLYFQPWWDTPVKPFVDSIGASLSAWFSGLNLNLGSLDIGKLISENMGALVGLGIGGVTALISYVKLRGQVDLNKELIASQEALVNKNLNLEGNVQGLTSTISNQASELQMYAKDTTAQQLQSRISELTTLYSNKEADYNAVLRQNQELMNKLANTPVKVVEVIK